MEKRVRLTSDALNCYGTRILTAGIDTSLYEKNPVMLWMHQRGKVVGYMKELERKDGELTAIPVFDEATDLSKQLKQQWEFGSLRMVSVSVDIIEMSDDKEFILPGQRYPTITKSKLTEVSMVDIGGNDDAIVLFCDGKKIELSAGGDCGLPQLNHLNNNNMKELEQIAVQLGLPKDATLTDIGAKIAAMGEENKATLARLQEATDALETMKLERITAMVEQAVKDNRLAAGKKDEFIELGKTVGTDKLASVLEAMNPQVKLSNIINGGEQHSLEAKKLSELSDEDKIALRKNDPAKYAQLYKAEYGVDCKLEQEEDTIE